MMLKSYISVFLLFFICGVKASTQLDIGSQDLLYPCNISVGTLDNSGDIAISASGSYFHALIGSGGTFALNASTPWTNDSTHPYYGMSSLFNTANMFNINIDSRIIFNLLSNQFNAKYAITFCYQAPIKNLEAVSAGEETPSYEISNLIFKQVLYPSEVNGTASYGMISGLTIPAPYYHCETSTGEILEGTISDSLFQASAGVSVLSQVLGNDFYQIGIKKPFKRCYFVTTFFETRPNLTRPAELQNSIYRLHGYLNRQVEIEDEVEL